MRHTTVTALPRLGLRQMPIRLLACCPRSTLHRSQGCLVRGTAARRETPSRQDIGASATGERRLMLHKHCLRRYRDSGLQGSPVPKPVCNCIQTGRVGAVSRWRDGQTWHLSLIVYLRSSNMPVVMSGFIAAPDHERKTIVIAVDNPQASQR